MCPNRHPLVSVDRDGAALREGLKKALCVSRFRLRRWRCASFEAALLSLEEENCAVADVEVDEVLRL